MKKMKMYTFSKFAIINKSKDDENADDEEDSDADEHHKSLIESLRQLSDQNKKRKITDIAPPSSQESQFGVKGNSNHFSLFLFF